MESRVQTWSLESGLGVCSLDLESTLGSLDLGVHTWEFRLGVQILEYELESTHIVWKPDLEVLTWESKLRCPDLGVWSLNLESEVWVGVQI